MAKSAKTKRTNLPIGGEFGATAVICDGMAAVEIELEVGGTKVRGVISADNAEAMGRFLIDEAREAKAMFEGD